MSLRSVGSILSPCRKEISPEQNAQKLFVDIEKLEAESHIDEYVELGSKRTKDGLIRTIGFTTLAGHAYAGIVGIPREQTSAVPVIGTSAWFTSIEGHNEHTARTFMREGNPVFFVGAEGSYHGCKNRGGRLGGITLSRSAASVLKFSSEMADEYTDIDPENRVLIGESRGAMVGMGVVVLGDIFGQNIVFSDLTAPCFPRRFSPLADTLKLVDHLKKEPLTIVSLAGKLPYSLLRHYPATVDLSLDAFTHQIAIWPALFSGEAGDLARLVPVSKAMHVTTYDDDAASMHKVWVDIFNDHPDVRVTPLGGSHLTIADPQTLAYLVARNKIFQQQMQNDGINAQEIYDGAHCIIEERFQ